MQPTIAFVTRIVLASASPRRQQLLAALGWELEVVHPEVDEAALPAESPVALVMRLARSKARAVARARPGQIVVGADTTVVLDGEALAKPAHAAEARQMLSSLQGRTHHVLTGYCVIRDGTERSDVVRTAVTFRPLTDREIESYVALGESLDKAGAYGIQGHGGALVDRVEGSYPNVVGLPVAEVMRTVHDILMDGEVVDGGASSLRPACSTRLPR